MAYYVNDPDQPGKKIDSIKLQIKYPDRILDPVKIQDYLNKKVWTLRQALLLLAGYDPITEWDCQSNAMSQIGPGQIFFLDGTNSFQLYNEWKISHPRNYENLSDFLSLNSWMENQDLSESHPPSYWIEWAKSNDFEPYWLGYVDKLKKPQEVTHLQAASTQKTATPAPTAVVALVEPDKAGPVECGLPTKEIAAIFDGLNEWGAKRWLKNLSASKWLHPARTALGGAGVASSVWNPLTLAQLMHNKKKGEKARAQLMNALHSRFNRNPALVPWRDDFNEYFATFCMTD